MGKRWSLGEYCARIHCAEEAFDVELERPRRLKLDEWRHFGEP